jgi:nucleotide-binding universal stress UspA family protein
MQSAYQKVLVAIDGSEASERVLDHVDALAAIHDSEVIVYHVRPKTYSGAATISLDDVAVVSTDDAAKKLNETGLTARGGRRCLLGSYRERHR